MICEWMTGEWMTRSLSVSLANVKLRPVFDVA
jgi:hypothetical protein